MNHIIAAPILILITAVVISGCKDQEKHSTSNQDAPVEESTSSEYPCLYEKYLESGSEVEGAGTFSLNPNPKMMDLIEERFLRISKSEGPSTFGIKKSADEYLLIRFTPGSTTDARTVTAIWKRPEKEEAGTEVSVESHSEPIDSEAEAFELLKSYARADTEFQSAVQWTVKKKSMQVPIDLK